MVPTLVVSPEPPFCPLTLIVPLMVTSPEARIVTGVLAAFGVKVTVTPVGILNVKNYFAPLLVAIDHAVEEGFIFAEHRKALSYESDPNKLLDAMALYEHPHDAVKRWMKEE